MRGRVQGEEEVTIWPHAKKSVGVGVIEIDLENVNGQCIFEYT